MDSRTRILKSLEHNEPDRVPYDLAGTHVTGIHVTAYKNLCTYIGIDPEPIQFADVVQQIVIPKQDIFERFEIDTRGLFPWCSHNWNVNGEDNGEYFIYTDEWGIAHQKPKRNGFFWSLAKSPLSATVADVEAIKAYKGPVPDDPRRIENLRDRALEYRQQGKIVIVKGLCAGIFEMAQRIRGMENILCDFISDQYAAELLLDKIFHIKHRFWDMALSTLGDVVDIIVETDDYGTQDSQLISPQTFRTIIKPRLSKLLEFTKKTLNSKKPPCEKGYIFFHSCGNISPLLPDFIEMGIDIINPVHINALGMDPKSLKRDFGRDITFWGGGVEAQNILPTGTTRQVRENVHKNLEALMPGGGYVFNTVHNIQAEVPPQNIIAMWNAVREFGKYS